MIGVVDLAASTLHDPYRHAALRDQMAAHLFQIIHVSHSRFSRVRNVSDWCYYKLKRHKAQVVFLASAEAQRACSSLSYDLRYAKNP